MSTSHSSSSTTTLKPYLTLPHLLSLTWLAYPILSLLFVAFRLQLSSSSAQDAVSDAKGNLLLSCQAAEQAATAAASLPRYMAVATNQQIADAVNGTMNGARAALVLSLTVMETIINFIIDIYRSTFLCFLELIVQGGLAILIGAVQEINTFLTATFSSIRTSIQNDVGTANKVISTAVSAINKIDPFGNISVPQFNIPSLSLLENVTLPSDFTTALVNLNNSLPTVSQLKDLIEDFIDTPFEDLKADINNTFANLTFDSTVLPIPDQNTLSFCNQLDTSVVDDLGQDLLKATKIGIIVIIALALLLLGAHCCLEWYKWRCMHVHLERTRQAWMSDPAIQHVDPTSSQPNIKMTDNNLLVLAADSSHPLLTYIANRLATILHLSPANYIHLRWFLHYVFHPPALACFLIGFLGLLSVEFQLLATSPLEAKYTAQVASSVADFSNTIALSINSSMYNQSASYADSINVRVATIQNSVNDGLFGWVNGTTTTLNDTLNKFYSDIQGAVTFVFNNTVLEDPVQDFIKCIIGSKVEALEDALTFLHNNLQIDIPQVNESVLVLSPSDVNEAVQPISRAAVGSGSDGDGGIVGTIVNRYVQSLKVERIMFSIFIGLWCIVVIMAICILLYHIYFMPWLDKRRRRQWNDDGVNNGQNGAVSYTIDRFIHSDKSVDEKAMNLPSFTPMLSPQHGGFFGNSREPQSPFPPRNTHDSSYLTSHPLATLQPKFEKSWDSILDSSAENQQVGVQDPVIPTARAPRKLISLGKKARGKEVLVSDEERARVDAAEALGTDNGDLEERGWWSKFFYYRQKDSVENQQISQIPSSGLVSEEKRQGRPKPELTIRVDRAPPSSEGSITVVASTASTGNTDNGPGSAWSVSPGQPKTLLRLPLNAMTKRLPANVAVIRPSPRRNVSVPMSVQSSFTGRPSIDGSVAGATYFNHSNDKTGQRLPQTPASISSYAPGVIFQAYQTTSYVPPLPNSRKLSSSLAGLPYEQKLTQAKPAIPHARKSSHIVDPFHTPFDDDAGIVTNPFEVVAV